MQQDGPLLMSRAEEYCRKVGIQLITDPPLGKGLEGYVFRTTSLSVVKSHRRRANYTRELSAYLRLAQHKVDEIQGHQVPRLRGHDAELLVLEMDLVSPPFIVDFGGAYLDQLPEHGAPDADWISERAELFGENWTTAQAIIAELDVLGIFLVDVHPANIQFLTN